MKKIRGLLVATLLLAGILVGCTETPTENKESTKEGVSSTAVNVDATDWPRTFKDALGKEIVIEKNRKKLPRYGIFILKY